MYSRLLYICIVSVAARQVSIFLNGPPTRLAGLILCRSLGPYLMAQASSRRGPLQLRCIRKLRLSETVHLRNRRTRIWLPSTSQIAENLVALRAVYAKINPAGLVAPQQNSLRHWETLQLRAGDWLQMVKLTYSRRSLIHPIC